MCSNRIRFEWMWFDYISKLVTPKIHSLCVYVCGDRLGVTITYNHSTFLIHQRSSNKRYAISAYFSPHYSDVYIRSRLIAAHYSQRVFEHRTRSCSWTQMYMCVCVCFSDALDLFFTCIETATWHRNIVFICIFYKRHQGNDVFIESVVTYIHIDTGGRTSTRSCVAAIHLWNTNTTRTRK